MKRHLHFNVMGALIVNNILNIKMLLYYYKKQSYKGVK